MSFLPPALTGLLRNTGLYHPLHDWRRDWRFQRKSRAAIAQWRQAGCPTPPPDMVKYEVIRHYARKHATPVLVETGTWFGDAIFTLRREFLEIHSIELAPELHTQAVAALGHMRHLHLHLGDSATELVRIAQTLTAPALYWLDGHWCDGPSARGAKDTPIVEELNFLLRLPPRRDVVLVDDARFFNGEHGYPTVEELRQLVASRRPAASFELKDDIIRILPV